MTVEVTNAGPEADVLHVLPTAVVPQHVVVGARRRGAGAGATGPTTVAVPHPFLGELELVAGPAPDGTDPTLLFCDNETNMARLYGQPGPPSRRTASTTTSSPARRR